MAGTPATQGVSYPSLRVADDNLEKTYIIRLFAKFEDILREYLLAHYPGSRVPWKTEDLINRVASRHRLPGTIRDEVHRVRVYRNAIVHRPDAPVAAVSFLQALTALNRFIARL